MPQASIKNEKMYEDLRRQGDSTQKPAGISNAAAARGASAVGSTGYSGPTKAKLISKLRNS